MKKGFTLMEVLAVIIILAVISLIAFPKLTSIIEKARLDGAKTSAESYIHALEIAYVGNNLKSSDKWLSPDVYDAPLDSKYEVKVKGQKPTKGWISVDNDRIDEYSLQIGNYVVNFDGNITTVTKGNTLLEKPNYIFVLSYDENKMKDDEEFEYDMKYGYQNILFRGNLSAYCLALSGTFEGEFINQDYCSVLLDEAASRYGLDSDIYSAQLSEIATEFATPEACENFYETIIKENSPDELPDDFSHSCYKRTFKNDLLANSLDKLNNKMYIKTKIDKESRVYDLSACIKDDKEICINLKDDFNTNMDKIKKYADFDEKTWTKLDNPTIYSSSLMNLLTDGINIWIDPTQKSYYIEGNKESIFAVGYKYADYKSLKAIQLLTSDSSNGKDFRLVYFDKDFLNECQITYSKKEISCTAEKITDQTKLNSLKKEFFDE